MSFSSRARQLADNATPGPWEAYTNETFLVAGEVAADVSGPFPIRGEDGHGWMTPGTAELIAAAPDLARIAADQHDCIAFAAGRQAEALRIIESNGFVFDDLGNEPGNWKHLAFTLYSMLCDIDSHARPVLAAADRWAQDE